MNKKTEQSGQGRKDDAYRELIGIDVGGTFTDFVWLVDGRLKVHKESTTPADQSNGMLKGINLLGVSETADVVHGTTVATNALLERRGAKTALLTTKGFRDVLAIGRQNRPHLYKLGQKRHPSLVPDGLRFEVRERVSATGEVLESLDVAAFDGIVNVLQREQVESLAIVFLFSFLNTHHEEEAARVLRDKLRGIHISVSSVLLPEYREYERTATTVINAYVQPLVANYLARLKASLGARPVRVMQSSGGAINLDMAAEQAARLVLSGPAGGIVGAFEMARQATGNEAPHIITFDMGGTSTDVALCPGMLPRTSESVISDLPLRFPSTDIHTVGAGGGSIARVDAGGVLRVGPESAGAHPGPACYGRGGQNATVTDANLVLGRLNAEGFLGGDNQVQLDKGSADVVVSEIGEKLNLSSEEAALGVVRVANAAMERALRKVSVERGHDPREYILIPFGGAGPLHACELAEALEMTQILVPQFPGVLSALGLLMADVTYDVSASILNDFNALKSAPAELLKKINTLSSQVMTALSGQGDVVPELSARLDMRYKGQSYELSVDLSLPLALAHLDQAAASFHDLHKKRYGYSIENEEVEVVTLRVLGSIPGRRPELPVTESASDDVSQAIVGETQVWFEKTGSTSTPCYDRSRLRPGHQMKGPCIVIQYDTTLVITDLWQGRVDGYNNIHLWRTARAY